MAKSINDLNKVLNSEKGLILYHNSKGGFRGRPLVSYGRSTCDFGSGLYLSTDISRVSSIGRRSETVCYKTNIMLNNESVYRFDNIYLFYLYCIVNRADMTSKVSSKIKSFIKEVNNYEIVIGETLDGYDTYNVLNSFVYGSARLVDVDKKLKLSELGLQYCIKSQILLDSLHFDIVKSNDIAVCKEEASRPLLIQSVDDLTFSDLVIKVEELLYV